MPRAFRSPVGQHSLSPVGAYLKDGDGVSILFRFAESVVNIAHVPKACLGLPPYDRCRPPPVARKHGRVSRGATDPRLPPRSAAWYRNRISVVVRD
jgi:hypothetical protein